MRRLKLLKSLKLPERGDTIVEVLIAISVAGLVLFSSYEITNHNTSATQSTLEHTLALKVASSQLEMLRVKGSLDASYQCFKSDGTGGSGASCKQTPNGTGGVVYTVLVSKPVGLNDYRVSVSWQELSGDAASLNLYYRPPEVH